MTGDSQRTDLAAKLHTRAIKRLAERYGVIRELPSILGASVFSAKDSLEGNRDVMIVLPAASAVKSKHSVDVLISKAKALKSLEHKSILRLINTGQDEAYGYKGTFLVFESVGGTSLREMLSSKDPLPVEVAIQILTPVADAIDGAHGLGLRHVGLTPSWIYVDDTEQPHVLGFGIGDLIIGVGNDGPSDEQSADLLPYTSPEELNGSSISVKRDIYRFGAVAYECLTGNPPFYRGQVRRQILHSDPYAGRIRLLEGLPSSIAEGILSCLAKDPAYRPKKLKSIFNDDVPQHPTDDKVEVLPLEEQADDAAHEEVLTPSEPATKYKSSNTDKSVVPIELASADLRDDTTQDSDDLLLDVLGTSQDDGGSGDEGGRKQEEQSREQLQSLSEASESRKSASKTIETRGRSTKKSGRGYRTLAFVWVVMGLIGGIVVISQAVIEHQYSDTSDIPSVSSKKVLAEKLHEQSNARKLELSSLLKYLEFASSIEQANRQLDDGDSKFQSRDWTDACRLYEAYLAETSRILDAAGQRQTAFAWRDKSTNALNAVDESFLTQYAYDSWEKLHETFRKAELAIENGDYDEASRLYASFADAMPRVHREAQLYRTAADLHKEATRLNDTIKADQYQGVSDQVLREIRSSLESGERAYRRGSHSEAIEHYKSYTNQVRGLVSTAEGYQKAVRARGDADLQRRRWYNTWQSTEAVAAEIDTKLIGPEQAAGCSKLFQSAQKAFSQGKYAIAAADFEIAGEGFRVLCDDLLPRHLIEVARHFDKPDDQVACDKAVRVLALLISLDPSNETASELRGKIARYLYFPGSANKAGDTRRIPLSDRLSLLMTYVPAGTFMMGSPPTEPGRDDDEKYHRVDIARPFMIGVAEVTQSQWRTIMGQGLREQYAKAGKRLYKSHTESWTPMYYINWSEAAEFCEKLTAKEREAGRLSEGLVFRLPTEAEWEYACRADSSGPFALDETPTELGWFETNSDDSLQGIALRDPNNWGIHDMHGNLYEWCADRYVKDYPDVKLDPYVKPTASNQSRVLRGGAWASRVSECRSAARHSDGPDTRSHTIGFRIVLGRPLDARDAD